MKNNNRHKVIDYTSWTLLFASIFLMNFTSSYVENVINGKKFVFEYLIVGITIASILMYLFYRLDKSYFKSANEKRGSAVLSQIGAIIVFSIFIATFYNYNGGVKILIPQTVKIEKYEAGSYIHNTFIHIYIHGKRERFKVKQSEYTKLANKDSINIYTGKGVLNYEFIYRFDTIEK